MPLYSDSNYYYSGGSSQLYSPYYSPGLYSTPTSSAPGSSGGYSPYTSSYNRSMGGSYVVSLTPTRSTPTYTSTHALPSRYKPNLSTITETLPLMGSARHGMMPLTRIQSPKYNSYSSPSTSTAYVPKYVPPRPILINTADIDVSSNSRFRKHKEEEEAARKEAAKKAAEEKSTATSPTSSLKRQNETQANKETTAESIVGTEQSTERKGARSTIKRNRAVVRLSTIRSRSKDRAAKVTPNEATCFTREPTEKNQKELPEITVTEEKLTWRQKLADDLAAIPTYPLKKSPGDKIRERYLIQDDKSDDSETITTRRPRPEEQPIEEVVIEIDPLHHTIRRLSIPQCPTFHEICEDISSDKIDDDLNAGELRRRASLIQEKELELLNQLQNSPSGTFQLIHLERQDSHDSLHDDSRKSAKKRKSKRGSKKLRHKITAIVDVENSTLTPIIQESEEYQPRSPKPKFTFNVDAVEEHDEIHKIFKLPKKKSIKKATKTKNVALPEGFVQAVPKNKTPPKAKPKESFVSMAEIFTFEENKLRNQGTEQLVSPKSVEKYDTCGEQAPQTLKSDYELDITNTTRPTMRTELNKVLEAPGMSKTIMSMATDTALESPKIIVLEKLEKPKQAAVAQPPAPIVLEMTKEDVTKENSKNLQSTEINKVEQTKIDDENKASASCSPTLKSSIALKVSTAAYTTPKLLEKQQSLNIEAPKATALKKSAAKIANKAILESALSLDSSNVKPLVPTMKHFETLHTLNTVDESTLLDTSEKCRLSSESSDDTKQKSEAFKNEVVATKKPATLAVKPSIKTALSLEAKSIAPTVPATQQLEKSQSLNLEDSQASVATPKPIRKFIQKSDSGEDFWTQIGSRETLYMTNRKKTVLEDQWQKREQLLESQNSEEVKYLAEIKHVVTAQKEKALKQANVDIKSDEKKETERTHSNESSLMEKTKTATKKNEEITKPKTDSDNESKNIKNKKSSPLKAQTKVLQEQLQLQPAASTKVASDTKTINTPAATTTLATAAPQQSTIYTLTTTTTAMDTTPKINTGQVAKSPEEQQQKFATTTPAAVTATKTTTTLSTTPMAGNKIPTTINKTITTAAAAKTVAVATVTEKSKAETLLAAASTTTATAKVQAEIKTVKQPEAAKKPSPQKTATPATATAITNDKTKPKIAAGKAKSSPSAKTSPSTAAAINADQFVSFAAPKVASPTTNKPKTAIANASSTAATVATGKQQKSTMPTTITIASTPATKTTTAATATKLTTTLTTAAPAAESAKTITTTTIASATTTAVAQPADPAKTDNSNDSDTRGGNNLSKFATVSNLAQYLQDVDAEIEDYIPSSAENSDSDSSCNYSSIDGCENLSASMKKKLKQRRKKEKAAEKARFDPQKKVKIDTTNKCYVNDEPLRHPLVATPRPLWKREKIVYPPDSEDDSDSDEEDGSGEEETEDSEECSTTSEEYDDELNASATASPAGTAFGGSGDAKDANSAIIRMSTCSNDSGFEGGTAPSSPKKMLGAQEARESPSTPPSTNPAYTIEANEEHDETSYTYSQFQKSGRFTPPATIIPRFKTYSVDDFHFLAVLGKGSFGKVLLAELRNTEYYYAVKCLKKDVVLEDDDVDSTLIERKVLALGTKHPYLCHLFCTFQTESHLFFVMEYLNGGDLMFHIQDSGRFPEERARFYGAEIISGLKFLHKKGIIYRDLKLDNVLLDFDGHVRIADFGMCKLQIYLDKTADSFCGTPDYMAPEIIKGEKYNQNVDWWSFGVLLYEMLIGQSPFSGCDEDELFWSICNEVPWFPVYISAEATSILKGLLEKDYAKRIGSQYSLAGDIADHIFFSAIDWNLLDKRQLDPPYKPQVKHPLDTQYFDRVFTRERVRLTPIDKDILQSMDQKQFHGFSYTNPHITLD